MRLFLIAIAALAGIAAAPPALAAVVVTGAWIRTPPPGAQTAAGYAVLANRSIATDRLTGGHTSVAASVEVHQTSMGGGMMRMKAMPQGLAIAGSSTVRLRPEGYHLMLTGLRRPLKAGQKVRITLSFQRSGDVAADFAVRDNAP